MASVSVTDIYNMALSHLGVGKEVGSLTEKTEEARACNRFYETVRDQVLTAFPWPFARKIAELSLVKEDPTDEWDYSYQVPSDCLMVRRILSGYRTDSRSTRVPYIEMNAPSGKYIYTDQEDAFIEYTSRVETSGYYPSEFAIAISFLLAVYVAPRLSGGDPFKNKEYCLKMYDYLIQRAQSSAANEDQPDIEPDSEFIAGRE